MIEKDICISEEERKEHDKQITMQNVNTLGDERKEYDLLIARQTVGREQLLSAD